MTKKAKAIALIVAGAVLVALPEPVTTPIGVALITKGIKMLKGVSEEANTQKESQTQDTVQEK
ncbi:MAG: hypothetical protein GXO26_04200 [Crenarchaeota archaeon]|nr:hypothetical protein [Thermoproteota archaeon]